MFELTSSVLYSEINFLSILLLTWVLFILKKESDEQRFTRLLIRLVKADFIMLIFELCRHFSEDYPHFYINSIVFSAGYITAVVVSYYWFLFLREICKLLVKQTPFNFQHRKSFGKRHVKDILFGIPAIITIAIVLYEFVVTLVTRGMGDFHAKTHFIIRIFHKIFTYSYFTLASMYVLANSIKRFRKICWLSSFSKLALILVPFFSGCMGIVFKSGAFSWQVITILIVIVFFDMQISRVSNDGLTGLNNRKAFDKFFDLAINEYRTGKTLCLFIIDIDDFKKINDSYGHLEGDSVLILVANALKDSCRNKDGFIARYGGDEFVILLWLQGEQDASKFEAEVKSFVQVKAKNAELPYDLTVSIGCACRSVAEYGNATLLFKNADDALYKAKKVKKSYK